MVENNLKIEDIPESYQEYIETIYRLSLKKKDMARGSILNSEISKFMGIKPSSVTNMLRKLEKRDLINWKPRSKNIYLTKSGEKIGKKVIHNHLIMELFLTNVLGINDINIAHKFACELEHHMQEPIFNAFIRVIGKKNALKIENFIENEKDPEQIHSQNIIIIPTPEKIISDFVNNLIQKIPDNKKEILDAKERFLEDY
ncbi:MAG: metal-dependent transcriptional regulator [Promethearchaeota archaeon]